MQRLVWILLFVAFLAPGSEAADAVRPCEELYASMPRRVLNYMPALILNANDKGSDEFHQDLAALVANKTDDCTVTYNYYDQGVQNPPACSETISFCPVSAPQDISSPLLAAADQAQPIDYGARRKQEIEEEKRAYEAEQEELRRKGLTWENEVEAEEFLTIGIKYKEDGDKAAVLADVASVGGVLVVDEDKQWLPRVIDVKISRDKKQALIEKLKENPHVERFYKRGVFTGQSSLTITDPNYFIRRLGTEARNAECLGYIRWCSRSNCRDA